MIAELLLISSGVDPDAKMARFITSITALSTAALAIEGEGCLLLSGVCEFGGVLSHKRALLFLADMVSVWELVRAKAPPPPSLTRARGFFLENHEPAD